MDLNDRFMTEITKCSDPTIFLGVARILKVDLLSEEKDAEGHRLPRPFEDIVIDVLTSYARCPRDRKRELLKIFTKANKEESKDAPRT